MSGGPFRGSGRGKLIVCGEHAVVHGHPAIAAAIDRGLTVTLTARPGPTAPPSPDARLASAIARVLPPEGWRVEIASELPVGRGMGSSAALAVALVRAAAAAAGEVPDAATVYERAFSVERVFHGDPSGLDHAVSDRGGVVRYRRGPPPELRPLPVPDWSFVVLDSGTPGDTRAMVAAVAARLSALQPVVDAIGELVLEAEEALDDAGRLGPILDRNHELLGRLGVSTPRLDALARAARRAGAAGAKQAGAGGGGVVIGITERPNAVLRSLRQEGIDAFACKAVVAP